jgi:hypothetical protein
VAGFTEQIAEVDPVVAGSIVNAFEVDRQAECLEGPEHEAQLDRRFALFEADDPIPADPGLFCEQALAPS